MWGSRSESGHRALFFQKHGGSPRTRHGSACANLGGWHVATGQALPLSLQLDQGRHVGRACVLQLDVDADGTIRVTGNVIELGRGSIHL